MRPLAGLCILALCIPALAGCTLPRGAPLRSEVVRADSARGDQPFSVVEVTTANVASLDRWPVTGWSGGYLWPEGTRGPASNVLRPGDLIDLVVWDSQENSLLAPAGQRSTSLNQIVVSPAGTVFVPYLEEVVVVGLSPPEARELIQRQLMPVAPTAQVQLSFAAGRNNSVDLVSGVANPGSYPLPDRNFSVMSLIAQGGGISPGLRNPLVRLIRDGKTYEIRSDRLFADAGKDVVLRGGDKVLVSQDQRYFTALGASGSEELVYFDKEDITAFEALALIGGLSDARANPKGVLVLRDYPPSALRSDGAGPDRPLMVFSLDLTSGDGLFAARNFRINPGDSVLVTESPLGAANAVIALIRSALGLGNSIGL
jgi:polysaccharide export outer membrane protein